MREKNVLDHASQALARRALLIMLSMGTLSSMSGLLASTMGMVTRGEFVIIVCIFLFNIGTLVTLLAFRKVTLQAVATTTVIYYAAHMCVGGWISLYITGHPFNIFIYLLWFFPLHVFNKLVNEPTTSRRLARVLLVAPLLTILCLLPKWSVVLPAEQRVLLGIYCLIYICFAVTLNIVTRYREKYIVEQQLAESRKLTAEVFESISDCFISLDSDLRLTYLNDAACTELGVSREAALHDTLAHAAPHFLSSSILNGLQSSSPHSEATVFEAQSHERNIWYDLRCFPKANGISIYFRDITRRKANEARIQYLAFYDVLTGLPNRQLLNDRLALALTANGSRNSIGALLHLDLDDFKSLNATMSHEVGDALLQQVALRIISVLHTGHVVARTGGDEFGIILKNLGQDHGAAVAQAKAIGESILQSFRAPFVIGSCVSETTASIGLTFFADTSEAGAPKSVDDLLRHADLALYRAKDDGGNTLCFFDPAMEADVEQRAALRNDLRNALQNDEFTLHFQSQVDSRGRICGAEALLRWNHPERGNVPPTEFIALAEEAGLIVELGGWVLKTACDQLATWAAIPHMSHITLAVNVSVRQFVDPHFVDLVEKMLRSSGANPHRLKLELTESSIMEKVDEVIAKMRQLKSLGIGFSIDDFGTGYSSLSHLRSLPLDQLKIDRSFIASVLTDEKSASITRTIILLARSLKLSVIAEGVETEAQREFLFAEGCHLYQGFLFSPAVTASRFEAFVTAEAQGHAGRQAA